MAAMQTFSAWSAHNYPPSDTEKRLIQDDIFRIDIELAHLQFKKEKLEHLRHQREGALSALRRIPNEILSEIMQIYCALLSRDELEQLQRSFNVLFGVCSRWRAVAVSIPQVVVLTTSPHCTRLNVAILARSGDSSFEIHSPLPHILAVRASTNSDARLLRLFLSPHIRRLGHVSSQNFDLVAADFINPPPFQRLQSIEISDVLMSPYHLFRIFMNCPILEDAEVVVLGTSTDDFRDASCHNLVLPCLSRLHITHASDPSSLFNLITAPRLAELYSIHHNDGESDCWPATSTANFLQRSGCSLKKIRFSFFRSNIAELWQLLDNVPFLVELCIHSREQTLKAVYEHLSTHPEQPPRLPQLHTLVIRNYRGEMCPDHLRAMLVSRSTQYPLRKIVLVCDTNRSGFELHPFEVLFEEAAQLGYSLDMEKFYGWSFVRYEMMREISALILTPVLTR